MIRVDASSDEHMGGSAYVVRRPRDSDAIGEALRSAYTHQRTNLPSEFRDVLDRLDDRS